MLRKSVLRKTSLGLAALLLLIIVIPASARPLLDGDGVINTNFPNPGDTQASPGIRLLTLPTYGDYSNMETDPAAITAQERDAALAEMQKAVPQGISVVTLNKWDDAKEGVNAIQIVNNVPIKGATYTIFLPAHWSKKNKIPVLLSGNGAGIGNNQRLWKQKGHEGVQLVGKASDKGHSGLILAYSNCGGTESQGVDEHTYKSVGAFFDFIAQNGGDPQQAIMAGGSRGGGTALMWAINPLKFYYNAMAVFADIPPTAYGFLSQRDVQTYPNLGYIYELISHDPSAYKYGNSNGPGKPTQPFLAALIGSPDPAGADAKSPIGMAEGLKGKILVIGRGTHDAFFPLREFLAFDHHLTELNITHSTVITLGQGHIGNKFLADQLTAYIDAVTQGKTYQPPAGRFIYINTAPPDGPQVPLAGFLKGDLQVRPAPQTDLPFAAEFPVKAGVGLPVDLSMCGTPNTSYKYIAQDTGGKIWVQGEGKFDATECAHAEIKAPDAPDEYHWTFIYDGKEIPAINTPVRNEGGCGLPATTTIMQQQPAPQDLNGSEPSLSFGIDQYSVQEHGCTAQ